MMLSKLRGGSFFNGWRWAKKGKREGKLSETAKPAQQNNSIELDSKPLSSTALARAAQPILVTDALATEHKLTIPHWDKFTDQIKELFDECKQIQDGTLASYIPQLARVDPNLWGLSLCTVDGNQFSIGDSKVPFCFQSVSKAFNYAIAATDLGADYVHQFVGHEPSGRLFNEICLNPELKPHNPMINSGAIIITSLLRNQLTLADRYDFVYNEYKKIAGNSGYIGFNNSTFLSERDSASRNFAIAYFLEEYGCFPPGVKSIRDELDLYFQLCSLETHCESAAVMAATLANGGICPTTKHRCIGSRHVRDLLSLMSSCGMYDGSGAFAFHVGLPAKSGVSGNIIVVIPNVMGLALFSPPLNRQGNSVKGLAFCHSMINRFNFHAFDSLLNNEVEKLDPRLCDLKEESKKPKREKKRHCSCEEQTHHEKQKSVVFEPMIE